MTNDNGHKEEQQRKLMCSWLKEYCIGERCAQFIQMSRTVAGGIQQNFGMCSFTAMVQILSEINMKTQPPQQKIQIPKLVRG